MSDDVREALDESISTAMHITLQRLGIGCRCGKRGYLDCGFLADAVLDLPEVAALIADAGQWRNRGRGLPREFRVELEDDSDGGPS